jgi:putative ABC transport system permease protein
MFRIALKMLFGDHGKYLMLISGLTFASLLMIQQAGVFCGLMSWTFASLENMRAPIWVTDAKLEQVNDNKPLRDTDVFRVRSVDGVAWSAALYQGNLQARQINGSFKQIQLVGIDATTFAGAPTEMLEGSLDDLRLPNTVVIDDLGRDRLAAGLPPHPGEATARVQLGDVFEINDREARVVGICKSSRSFMGNPYVFTTYDRALAYAPPQRKMMSFVIAAPLPGEDAATVARRITQDTGLRAVTEADFKSSTVWWYVRNTGIPISFGTTVVLGIIVGMAIAGQTFYTFVLENLKHLGALKAMGTSNAKLCGMLMLQSFSVGAIGFGIGCLFTFGFALGTLKKQQPPFYLPWQVPLGAFGIIMFICAFAALLGIIKVARLEPAIVFRA